MAYSDFTLIDVKKKLLLSLVEKASLFTEVAGLPSSEHLKETLRYNVPLATAINTEKARSELVIAPILVEVVKRLNCEVSLFSGIEFNVDKSQGLNGICDFLVSLSAEQMFLEVPIIAIVEAKNDNINSGLGQCLSELFAAKLFNENKGYWIPHLYGVVTTGSLWKFMKLKDNTGWIDSEEYHVSNVEKIIGILIFIINSIKSSN